MQSPLARTALFLSLSLGAGLACATDGYFSHGYGVKAQGMGGVGIAFPQDALAAATNPAGTALVGDRVDVGLTWFAPKRKSEIVNNGFGNGQFDGNGKTDFLIPEFGYTKQLSPTTAAGISIYANGGMNTTYSKGIPLFGSGEAGVNLEQLFITPSFAWKASNAHTFGVALNISYQRFQAKGLQNFSMLSTSPGNLTNRGVDTSSGTGIRLGWIGQITPDLTLGASWASRIDTSNFDKYKGLFAGNGGFDIPEHYGLGVAYRVKPGLTVAADLEEIKYSGIKSVANPLAYVVNGVGPANGAGFGWRDVTVFKIGLGYELSKEVTLRAGYNHSDNPIPASQTLFNILAPGVVRDHLTLGATWQLPGNQEVSLTYAHAFHNKVKGVRSIPAGFGSGVGEANIEMDQDLLGAAYSWRF